MNLAIEMSMRENQNNTDNYNDEPSFDDLDEYDDADEDKSNEVIESKNSKKRSIPEATPELSKRVKNTTTESTTDSTPKNTSSQITIHDDDIELDIFHFTQKLVRDKFHDPTVSKNPDCTLQFRLPGGSTLKAGFLASTLLKIVLQYALIKGNIATKGKSFSLVTTFPRRQFTVKELCTLTLKDTDLGARAVLVIEENFVT